MFKIKKIKLLTDYGVGKYIIANLTPPTIAKILAYRLKTCWYIERVEGEYSVWVIDKGINIEQSEILNNYALDESVCTHSGLSFSIEEFFNAYCQEVDDV